MSPIIELMQQFSEFLVMENVESVQKRVTKMMGVWKPSQNNLGGGGGGGVADIAASLEKRRFQNTNNLQVTSRSVPDIGGRQMETLF